MTLDIGDVMDRADVDEEIAAHRARYIADEIPLDVMEEAIAHRLLEIQDEDAYRYRPTDAEMDADIRLQQQRLEQKRRNQNPL
jgi:hypothetical protein